MFDNTVMNKQYSKIVLHVQSPSLKDLCCKGCLEMMPLDTNNQWSLRNIIKGDKKTEHSIPSLSIVYDSIDVKIEEP